jgi:mannose-6-phosphate isomerase-like protein (cupin superfamily)
MDLKNIELELTKEPLDSAVGIKRIALIDGEHFGYHVAEIQTQVNAHVHRQGDETYHVLKGKGEIHLGQATFHDNQRITVEWEKPVEVRPGDVFNISQDYAHCLKNTGTEPLIIIFVCPPQHLTTDRYPVEIP